MVFVRKSGQASQESQGAVSEDVAAGGGEGGGAPQRAAAAEHVLEARVQRVEVLVSKGRGDVRIVGGDAVGGREAVLTVLRFVEQQWERIPGLRRGGIRGLDFYIAFPGRGGAVLGAGHGLEGAVLVATISALAGKRADEAKAIWSDLRETGQVHGGRGEAVVLQAGAREAIDALADLPSVEAILAPESVLMQCRPTHTKLRGVEDAGQLLSQALGIAMAPVKKHWRVKVDDARLFAARDGEAAAAEAPASQVGPQASSTSLGSLFLTRFNRDFTSMPACPTASRHRDADAADPKP